MHYGLCDNGQLQHCWVEVLHIAGFHVMPSNLTTMTSKFLLSVHEDLEPPDT